ncbi:heterokaryon incompatibility protein-domain-containing protein [Podospora aff. communis PSN243]|uniref:Heterokaryon incompatibility protein-domain-containing protein n=1 Tax=Podospora aff. communis PSN243 TaxID=3040156 RepID=A0AAV9GRZ8_9PEZI|nr:heterokaryon incompatibility protein-domain-containing protein [Podospora aff. communis PSN243]
MPYHGINSHLEPFLPYIEKATFATLNDAWNLPRSLSRPISIDTVKSWLASCDRHHGDHCNRGQTPVAPDQQPTFLIDVHRSCLVAATPGAAYATLSYVWGQARGSPGFSLTSDTHDVLREEGSLDQVDLPRTIRDAMAFVAALGLSYLWVDRLCIMQDNEEHKHGQIKAMGSIYSHSSFTIIAAQSHDAFGPLSSRPLRTSSPSGWSVLRSLGRSLTAWSRVTAPKRTAPPTDTAIHWQSPQTDRDVMAIMSADLLRTIWYSRGWTFQEFLFSKRKIIFHNNTINWECHCTSAHEQRISLPKEICMRPPVHVSRLGMDLDTWPNFHRFARLAALLTPRIFTFPEDVLDAFAGASTALARVYAGGLVTGIPEMVFDAALIWQPYHPMERRKAVLHPEEAVLPSWSWVSWRGNVHSESWQSGHDYLITRQTGSGVAAGEVRPRWSTFSTVQWQHSATLTSTRYPIQPQAPEWRRRYESDEDTLPVGWQKHVDSDARRFYTHHDISDHQFWYPIPIGIGNGRASRSRYLHCKTRHAKLQAQPKPHRGFANGCVFVALQDADGEVVGALRLNSSDRDERPTDSWDFIELSSGSVELRHSGKDLLDHHFADVFDEWILPGWKSQNEPVYEFYNVMNIGWTAPGVATRLAVGRVEKHAWERFAVEEIEISIG